VIDMDDVCREAARSVIHTGPSWEKLVFASPFSMHSRVSRCAQVASVRHIKTVAFDKVRDSLSSVRKSTSEKFSLSQLDSDYGE